MVFSRINTGVLLKKSRWVTRYSKSMCAGKRGKPINAVGNLFLGIRGTTGPGLSLVMYKGCTARKPYYESTHRETMRPLLLQNCKE